MTAYPSYAQRPPKFIAGARGLDFVNTVEWRGDSADRAERLSAYGELATWCAKAGLISAAEARRLITSAARRPKEARRVLRDAIALREAAAALLQDPDDKRRANALDRRLRAVRCHPSLAIGPDGTLQAMLAPIEAGLERPFALIAIELVAFLGSQEIARVHSCANPRCGWMFVDASRNQTRRWCDMAGCGNRSKARAHYARQRG